MKYLEIIGRVLGAISFLYVAWNGIRIDIGKPGEKAHILLEYYGAKRNFK